MQGIFEVDNDNSNTCEVCEIPVWLWLSASHAVFSFTCLHCPCLQSRDIGQTQSQLSLRAIAVPVNWLTCFYFHLPCSVAWLRAVVTTLQTPLAQKFSLWCWDSIVTLLKPSLEMPLIWLWLGENHTLMPISVWYQSLHTPASGPFSSHSKIIIFHLVPFLLRRQYACCCVSQWSLLKPSRKHKFYQLASAMTSFLKCTIPRAMAQTFSRLPPVLMKEMFRWMLMFLSSFPALGNSHRAGTHCPWRISLVGCQLQGQMVSLFLYTQVTVYPQNLLPPMFISGLVQSSEFAGRPWWMPSGLSITKRNGFEAWMSHACGASSDTCFYKNVDRVPRGHWSPAVPLSLSFPSSLIQLLGQPPK